MTGALAVVAAAPWFELPEAHVAKTPPEDRGLRRDGVKLLVTTASLHHRTFSELDQILEPGDLLVVNDSATLAAAVDVDPETVIHFSTAIDGGFQIVEVRRRVGSGSERSRYVNGRTLRLPGGAVLELLTPYPAGDSSGRLWLANATLPIGLHAYLGKHGRPITYDPAVIPQPLDSYQTVFARTPGSAEMPSAGRPFTADLVTRLVRRGIGIAPITLHAGVSSLEIGESPYPEWFEVSPATAGLINHTRRCGHRVVAVGTTVVRALETVASDERAHPGRGWTDLYVGPSHKMSLVDGLITGWHEPASTHLEMLLAVGGSRAIEDSYAAALNAGYLWHEFGDSHLILT